MPAFAPAKVAQATPDASVLLSTKACIRLAVLLCLAMLLVFVLGTFTDVDLMLADAMVDKSAMVFPWRDAWLTDIFGHRILKAVLTVSGALFIVAAIIDAIWPQAVLARPLARLRLRVIAGSAAAVPLVISLLKQSSNAHCPWDLARYGGSQPYVRLFEALPPGALPGHCLPAGHASSALWLISLAVLWLPGQNHKAWRAACTAIVLGCALGWMQQMRGAHFLTHTLWSVCIACCTVLTLIFMTGPRIAGRSHTFPPG